MDFPILFFSIQFVCLKLLLSISSNVGQKSGAFSQWHDLLGWFAPCPDVPHSENLAFIKKQLYLLWSQRNVQILLGRINVPQR